MGGCTCNGAHTAIGVPSSAVGGSPCGHGDFGISFSRFNSERPRRRKIATSAPRHQRRRLRVRRDRRPRRLRFRPFPRRRLTVRRIRLKRLRRNRCLRRLRRRQRRQVDQRRRLPGHRSSPRLKFGTVQLLAGGIVQLLKILEALRPLCSVRAVRNYRPRQYLRRLLYRIAPARPGMRARAGKCFTNERRGMPPWR